MKTKFLFYGKVLLFSLMTFIIFIESNISFGFEWRKTFSERMASSTQQLNDGGFIITGPSQSIWFDNPDAFLIKTDALGNKQWVRSFGGKGNDYGYSVQQTTDGGYVIVGTTDSFGASGYNVYLIKTDANGKELWSKTFGGEENDSGHSVQQTADGGFIIAGETGFFRPGGLDVYLIKTDSYGNEQWSKTIGGSETQDIGQSVQQTADGGFIIGGYKCWGWHDSYRFYLIKTDADGNELWSKTFEGKGEAIGRSVQQTVDNGYIFVGYTWDSFNSSGYDVYLVKTNSNGNEQWSNNFGEGTCDVGQSVQQTSDSGFIIFGSTSYLDAESEYAYLVKTDTNGNEQWSKTFRGGSGRSGQQTADDGFIIAGGTVYDTLLIYYKPAGSQIPETIQAEDYDQGGQQIAYYDKTPGNAGGQYRSDDVDIWECCDGTYYTGANSTGEWLNYTIDVPSDGNYYLDIRVATPSDNGRLHVEFDGMDKTGSLTVPNTGGWTTWQTLSAYIELIAGHQEMRLLIEKGGLNIDHISLLADFILDDETGFIIQAEDYDQGGQNVAYYDKTPSNTGGQYRNDDVDIWWHAPGTYYTGANASGEWLNYTIDVPYNGNYRFDLRVATPNSNRRVHVEFDGVDKTGPLTLPNTGWWTTWQSLSTNVTLTAGRQVMRLVIDYGGLNIDSISLVYVGS